MERTSDAENRDLLGEPKKGNSTFENIEKNVNFDLLEAIVWQFSNKFGKFLSSLPV